MDENYQDPMQQLKEQIQTRQPSDKPANDVLTEEEKGTMPENRFVTSTQKELEESDNAGANPKQKPTSGESSSSFPPDERLTEND